MTTDPTLKMLLGRFGGATPKMLQRVLTPYRLRIVEIVPHGKSEAKFKASVPEDVWTEFSEGTTGKVVPRLHVEGDAGWKEVIKARILGGNRPEVYGELYFAPSRFGVAIKEVKIGDYIEVDPFGVTSKIESALCEAALFTIASDAGFQVTRMPENVAKHVGTQQYYDFRMEKDGKVYRVELKSLWGTDTTKARLIHTVSKEGGGKNSKREDRQTWDTSSCRFCDQDIFAISMWLRTGNVTDFAFALSASSDDSAEWGLPAVPKFPHHVTQNPNVSDPPEGAWTPDLLEACRRVEAFKKKRNAAD